jgi:hypothetical protein
MPASKLQATRGTGGEAERLDTYFVPPRVLLNRNADWVRFPSTRGYSHDGLHACLERFESGGGCDQLKVRRKHQMTSLRAASHGRSGLVFRLLCKLQNDDLRRLEAHSGFIFLGSSPPQEHFADGCLPALSVS